MSQRQPVIGGHVGKQRSKFQTFPHLHPTRSSADTCPGKHRHFDRSAARWRPLARRGVDPPVTLPVPGVAVALAGERDQSYGGEGVRWIEIGWLVVGLGLRRERSRGYGVNYERCFVLGCGEGV